MYVGEPCVGLQNSYTPGVPPLALVVVRKVDTSRSAPLIDLTETLLVGVCIFSTIKVSFESFEFL